MIHSTQMLALSDTANVAVSAASLVMQLAVMVWLARQDHVIRRLDRTKDQHRDDMKELSTQLHDANQKLIDQRIRDVTHDLKGQAQQNVSALDATRMRQDRAEQQIEKLMNTRMEAEVNVTNALNETREFIRECAPSRKEFDKVETALVKLDERVDLLAEKVTTRDDLVGAIREAIKEAR